MFKNVETLAVFLWGKRVGAISQTKHNLYGFEYDPNWLKTKTSISPITLPIEKSVFTFPNLPASTYYNLPPAFVDSLPDRFGNNIITSELTRRGSSYEQIGPLDRLAYIGNHGMGALEYKPFIGKTDKIPDILNISELVFAAREIISADYNSQHMSNKTTSKEIRSLVTVGTSAGGARAKAVVNVDNKTDRITAGQFSKEGTSSWILKFDGVENSNSKNPLEKDYGKIEFIYSKMAKAAGINMPDTRLLQENSRTHFMTKRFDRTKAGEKLHYQSLCGMSVLDYNTINTNDYSALITTIEKLGLPDDALQNDKEEIFRRMVFNYLAMNYDDHTKNFGFIMDKGFNWRLSPAFDITYAYNSQNKWLRQHLMGVDGKYENVTKKDFFDFAKKFHIYGAKEKIEAVKSAIKQFHDFANEASLNPETTDALAKVLDENLL
ncbi:MAG: type II toxin-antitoxin system HipA family toxin [Bifidobacteriaceae bacterium]|jgi:serine/threonine-protein kinase HipA|nr:type II toxin-antitoxin system HipA family toxin [Bifidobacteriaceae bacterium]